MKTYNHNYNYSWTNEKSGYLGYYLIIEVNRIRLDSYSLPATKWSGGGSQYFTFDEYTENSNAYAKVKSCFGNDIAQNVLNIIKDKQNLPIFQEFEKYSKIIDNWLSKFQSTDSLLKIWKSLPHYDFAYPYEERFILYKIDCIKLNNEQREAKFLDQEWNSLICIAHENSQFQKLENSKSWKAYLIGNRQLIVLCEVLGEILVFEPLKSVEAVFENYYSEIDGIKKVDDLILVFFNIKRLNPSLGQYIVAIHAITGKVVYQKIK